MPIRIEPLAAAISTVPFAFTAPDTTIAALRAPSCAVSAAVADRLTESPDRVAWSVTIMRPALASRTDPVAATFPCANMSPLVVWI